MSAAVDLDDLPLASLEEASAITTAIRSTAEHLQDLLREAWRRRVWVPLGYPDWSTYVTAEFGDLALRLQREERRVEVATWRAEGASTRAIATALGVSAGTVAGDLHTVEGVGTADTLVRGEGVRTEHTHAVVVSLDGRRRPATRPTGTPRGTHGVGTPRPVTLRVLDALAAAGADGLTLVEVSRRLKIRDGSSSGALSRLEAQGHCARTGGRRDGRSVYVLAVNLQLTTGLTSA